MTCPEYEKKLKIQRKLEKDLTEKLDSSNLESFSRIKKYFEGKSIQFDRDIVIAHLDFEKIAKYIANNEEFTVVSGLNSSSQLHLGHKVLFDLLISLQKIGANIIIPVTNDESYADGKSESLKESRRMAYEEIIPNIIAFGFDPEKTKIFVDSDFPELYNFAMHLGKEISVKTVQQLFGDRALKNVSQMTYRGSVQVAQILLPQLNESGGPKHTLIPVGPDQHPYILLARKIAKRFGMIPPSEITVNFLQGLRDPEKKMSGSKPETAIFLSDTPKQVQEKINQAFTGCLDKLEDHKKYGAIPEICSVFQLLNYHHPNTEFVNNIHGKYKSGEMNASEIKKITTDFIIELLDIHQKKVLASKNGIDRFILNKKLTSFTRYESEGEKKND